jgi:acyl carrier protein
MQAPQIEQRVRDTISRVAKITPGFRGDADLFRELGVKSATALELLLSLEEEFDVSIPDAAFGDARSVDRLVMLVGGLGGNST